MATPLPFWIGHILLTSRHSSRIAESRTRKHRLPHQTPRFGFDQEGWKRDASQILFLVAPRLHVSIGEFLAIENERMIPQQAASTITNVDDIESYIKDMQRNGKEYLWAIDLPMADRRNVVRDLSYMGITAGSLFPGLDGACEELAMRNFEI